MMSLERRSGSVVAVACGVFVLAACVAACGSSSRAPVPQETSNDKTVPPDVGTSSGGLGDAGPGIDAGDGTCAAQASAAKRAEVDILFFIDTSGSMDEETAQVRQNINDFAKSIGGSGLDYQVIMVASKPLPFPIPLPLPSVCVPPPLGGVDCADNPPLFHHVNRFVDSNDPLAAALQTYDTDYGKWLRVSAHKVFIVITDDDSVPLKFDQFDTQLLAKSPTQFGTAAKRNYTWSSICGWQTGTSILDATHCSTAENIGEQYQRLSQLTGGTVGSVCEKSYAGVFGDIAKGLVTKLGCEFAVPKPEGGASIDPNKVVVKYTPGGATTGSALTQVTDASKCGAVKDAWYYDDNKTPTKILFCPSTCTSAGADTAGKLEVLVGCQAPPPR